MSYRVQSIDNYLSNHLLVATPILLDKTFDHTVSLICEHNEDGAMGFILNRPTSMHINELFAQMNIEVNSSSTFNKNNRLHTGGPVHQDRGFVIHSPLGDWESTLEVTDEVGVTASRDILFAIANGTGPKQFRVILGYSGWSNGQLEQEIASNSWLSVPADIDLLFNTDDSQIWERSANSIGIDINRLTTIAGHAG
ncbi:MAG: YqgE/AlgH family protein [Thiotrichales bacterium]|jgi:putative transcriptional regulator|nr:YqgE/AlgH family protein [Thiotrichales bacterium]MBT3612955.1 YqgE/AlgH family protein [Thiotrichales bacterium]MBT3752634.1 YqgE/AlgH family protein [Thiotrichales bacterium]MBT3837921.1 YqgE/AlgH family protein [Thiotrichales bacterium]MBT4151709.1 YqgE/AlgH family protein [Thiotrichales bacterium]